MSEQLHTDGNDVAGILQEVFGADLTGARRRCRSCGGDNPVAAHRAYHGAAVVLRARAATTSRSGSAAWATAWCSSSAGRSAPDAVAAVVTARGERQRRHRGVGPDGERSHVARQGAQRASRDGRRLGHGQRACHAPRTPLNAGVTFASPPTHDYDPAMLVAEAVGRTLAREGVEVVFGVMGSGNLAFTNHLRDAGATFHAARHEGGAICMADGYARVSGTVAACSVHQGPGLTNAITGLTEAAKSRTPLVLVAADTPAAAIRSNFRIEQDALVRAVGAVAERVHGPATAVADTARAVRRARVERRAVVLMVAARRAGRRGAGGGRRAADGARPTRLPPAPAAGAVAALAELLAARSGRCSSAAAAPCSRAPAPPCARSRSAPARSLATSAVANGLFRGDPFDLGIAGGFATPARRPAARGVRRHRVVRRRAEPVDDAPRHRSSRTARASPRSTSTPTRSARTCRSARA